MKTMIASLLCVASFAAAQTQPQVNDSSGVPTCQSAFLPNAVVYSGVTFKVLNPTTQVSVLCLSNGQQWILTPAAALPQAAPTGANQTLQSTSATASAWTSTPIFNNPTIIGPAPVACGATCSVTVPWAAYLLNQAAGSTATLPASSGSGNVYKFLVTVATTSAQEKILLTTTTDTIIGTAILENGGTAKIFVGNAGTYHSIQMPFAGTQPSGGFIGDAVTCTDVATGSWACQIVSQSGNSTPVTPYSTSTT